jgi:excisionase family DNA binding protein
MTTSHAPAANAVALLTTLQVARVFSVSPKTIHAWGRDGHLPAVRIGQTIRFHPAVIDQLIGASPQSR